MNNYRMLYSQNNLTHVIRQKVKDKKKYNQD